MAIARADLIVDTTSTSGTGTYTLNDPASPGGGYRTLADAVAAGHVTDGDTVYYVVRDTTTQGGSLDFERGSGTVGSSGTTLTRTVTESSNSNNEVDWPVGGSRSVAIVLDAASFGLLAAAQTWAAVQTFSQTALLNAGARLNNNFSGRLILDNAGIIRGQLYSTTTPTVRLDHVQSDGSTVDTRIELGNTNVDVTGVLRQGGTAVALQGVLSAPSGTRLLLGNNSVPAGWAIVAAVADKTILTTSTVSEIDDQAGSWTISGLSGTMTSGISVTVNGHSITTTELPAVSFLVTGPGAVGGSGTANTTVTGAGDAHDHTASASTAGSTTISSTGAWRPSYYKAGWIQKS